MNDKYYDKYNGNCNDIDIILKDIGVPSKYIGNTNNRKPIAVANGISMYNGNEYQNLALSLLAKGGKLNKIKG